MLTKKFYSGHISQNSNVHGHGFIPPQKYRSDKLRDRAGLPISKLHQDKISENDSMSSLESFDNGRFNIDSRPSSSQKRTQAERSHMNHQEHMIALDLLEDLSIPLESLLPASQNPKASSESRHHVPRANFYGSEHFQSILSAQQRSRKHKTNRKIPTEISEEVVQAEDLIKELVDAQIKNIDSLENDHDLINWIRTHMFPDSTCQTSISGEPRERDGISSAQSRSEENQVQEFESLSPVNFGRPFCRTPLSTPLLVHLLTILTHRFQRPHTALYIFHHVKSHHDPLVRYMGLSRPVYLQIVKLRWSFF